MSARKKASQPKRSRPAAKNKRTSRFADWDLSTIEVLHEGDAVDTIEIVPPLRKRPAKAARKR